MSHRRKTETPPRHRAFDSLALDVSGFGPASTSTPTRGRNNDDDECEVWEDYGVVEYLELGLASPDESTEEDRVEQMRETLAETDILEDEGGVSDFLFHVARTKHGKVYIRVIRTLLLNRGEWFIFE